MNNPYSVSNNPFPEPLQPPFYSETFGTPKVVFWFKVYATILCFIYVLTALMGIVMMVLDLEEPETPRWVFIAMGAFLFGIGVSLFVACFLPLILKPRPWLWIFDLVLICLGMTSACFLPFCIPLLIFWLRPGVKHYFGRLA